jgi:dTDP-4-amino-4,6-dideoxygalactose transaminase
LFAGAYMKVPLLDLKAQYASIRNEVLDAVGEVLESQVCIGGPRVSELEEKVAAVSGCKYAVGVSSGTDAILAALMCLGVGPGDEIVTTPFTFFATAGCIARTGAKPVFVDIDPKTYNINPALIEAAITARTKAIMPVHLFGQVCDMDPILEIAARRNLFIVEDAAQAIGATYKGRVAGSMGAMGCFSFYPSKNLGAVGEGGMVVTNDQKLHKLLMVMRNHGSEVKYFHQYVGGNFRLDPIQAAVLLVKLPRLNEWSAARRRNAAIYDELFAGSGIVTPCISQDCVSIFNQYVVRSEYRDDLMEYLKGQGIGTEIYYPVPMHLQECFRSLGYKAGDFPESEKASRQAVALPIYPELTREMLEHVASAVLAHESISRVATPAS